MTGRPRLTRRLRVITSEPDFLLEEWYRYGISISTWICEECGWHIPHTDSWQRVAAQCHILPKDKFDSARAYSKNRLHLCLFCHDNFDNSWASAATMKIFPIAVLRLKSFARQVVERIPDVIFKDLI